MRLALFLAARLLRRRGSALLRTSALAALIAVALGAASLVVALALMSGYTRALRDGVLAAGGHVVALYPGGLSRAVAAAATEKLERLPGVTRVAQAVYLAGMLFPRGGGAAELVSVRASTQPLPFVHLPAADPDGPLAVAIGRGVARRLSAAAGEVLSLQVVTGRAPRSVPVRIAAVFATGFSELDERWVVADFAALSRRVADLPGGGLEVFLADPSDAPARRDRVEAICGDGALVSTWEESNRNLFAALRWQKLSLGLVLSLVLGVGAFEVASALVVLVTEKRRELGILLALGSDPRLMRRTLLLAGGALGAAGVAAGVLLGVALAVLLSLLGVPHFPPDIASIYMVETIPLRIVPGDIAAVLALSLAEVLLAAMLPARRAARREPVE
ncbi:MAG TPA: FtsX-like permease family protein, partial [Thermoanaerobaculaceae bacterium]|nr:FtsX-like permease family protein [Thermoanaerobaculaceae bacterium]